MKKQFKDLAAYVRLHDGFGKPKIDLQAMYGLFPTFEFTPTDNFGQYRNFGEAFEHKDMSMRISDGQSTCLMTYKIYGDANENTAYIS